MKCVCVYILIYSSSLGNWNSSQNLDPSHKNVGVSLVTQLVKNLTTMQETQFDSQVRKIRWRRDRLPTAVFLRFPCGSAGKESVCNLGDLGLTPGLGRFSGEGTGYPLQYSGLENSMDCIVHGVTKSRTQLSDFYFHNDVKILPP